MSPELRGNSEEYRFYQQYITEISRYPFLKPAQEKKYLRDIKRGSKRARHALICSNLRFVNKVAFMYRGQGLPLMDLINEGNIGLIEAARRYDIAKKVKFTSYAVWWIRQTIIQAIFEKARIVRLSAANELNIRRIERHNPHAKECIGGNGKIDSSKLADSMGYTHCYMQKLLTMNQSHLSLDANSSTGDNSPTLQCTLKDPGENPETAAFRKILNQQLTDSILHLTPMERKILTFSFGLNGNKPMNLRELGEMFSLSKERIRQIRERALDKLRDLKLQRDYLVAA